MSIPPTSLPPEAWQPALGAARRIAAPIQRFLAIEAASGLVLIAATAIALGWANSPWASHYDALWSTPIAVTVGGFAVSRSLHFLVNDGLMTVFFFVVGLEIRREIHGGELSELRRAALPLAAALGGMAAPALIFVAFNASGPALVGWAVPMATDIAFAVGVLTLLGARVPAALRVLLLALAVIDDIGAIVVIALFYSAGVNPSGLGIAAIGVAIVLGLQAIGIRRPWIYVAPGAVVWIGLHGAGIHPTLAGVVLGLLTPARAWFGLDGFARETRQHVDAIADGGEAHDVLGHLDDIERVRREAVSPVDFLVHRLHPLVSYAIMPLFALANAGVSLGGASFAGAGLWCFVGIVAGLVVGKPLGIGLASLGASASGVAKRPRGATGSGIALVGIVGGIGFTMSLFIAQLAFPHGPMLATAKLAILVGSAAAALLGLVLGHLLLRPMPGVAVDELTAERSTDD